MKMQFKVLFFLLSISNIIWAQKKQILHKTFDTNDITTMIVNLNNSTVNIQSSQSDKVQIDYKLEFIGFSNGEISEKLKEIEADANMFDNHITLTANSIDKLSYKSHVYSAPGGIVYKGSLFNKSSDNPEFRKTRDSIIAEINYNDSDFFNKHLEFLDENEEVIKNVEEYVKTLNVHFTIEIPNNVKLTINAKDSQIRMNQKITNELVFNLKKGSLKALELSNDYNKVKIEDADLKIITLSGGNYIFNNISRGLIGSVSSSNITSEFSEIQIGEIQENVSITDFTSSYWFYNWSDRFTRFDLFSEYSKIHFFYPVKDHSLKVFGNNTKNILDNGAFEINMQPTSSGEKFNMMHRKPKGEGQFSGAINFDIIHGIIYSHNDSIKKINN